MPNLTQTKPQCCGSEQNSAWFHCLHMSISHWERIQKGLFPQPLCYSSLPPEKETPSTGHDLPSAKCFSILYSIGLEISTLQSDWTLWSTCVICTFQTCWYIVFSVPLVRTANILQIFHMVVFFSYLSERKKKLLALISHNLTHF